MSFPQGTTPSFTFELPEEYRMQDVSNIYVTFQSYATTITKSGDDLTVDGNLISVTLTQEDTLKMSRSVAVQINWTYADGTRMASDIERVKIDEQLLQAVVE